MSQNSTELMAPEEGGADPGSGQGFFGRLSSGSKVLLAILAVVLVIAIIFAVAKLFGSSNSSSTAPVLPPAGSPATSEATTTTTGGTATTFSGAYGNRDPFVPLVAATVVTSAPTASPTTTTAPSGVVVPTTATTVPSQISLVSVSPAGTSPTAEVSVGSTTYPGLTVGTTFANGAYKITSIDQSTACATFTGGGSSSFQLCTGQAVLK
ncbi:MAG: hypothetical protein M0Z47_10295 [Actinomycetota bacterium]|nr:hypothetical protein [Actinomycetota bacterium]